MVVPNFWALWLSGRMGPNSSRMFEWTEGHYPVTRGDGEQKVKLLYTSKSEDNGKIIDLTWVPISSNRKKV